jgi:two-component system phosphate regulon response regulator PhoB
MMIEEQMRNILVVEDGEDFQLMIMRALGADANRLVMASSVAQAARILSQERFDLILLDISLPDGDGFEVFTFIQGDEAHRNVPVIFLTASTDLSKKVAAFALGAEDYVVKPFNAVELKARVEAKLRRSAREGSASQVLRKGALKLNVLSQKAYKVDPVTPDQEEELQLTPLEFKILSHFIRNEDRVLSREQILDAVWGSKVHVFDRTVDTHVSALRRKISPHGDYIQAVLGAGYCFSTKDSRATKARSA